MPFAQAGDPLPFSITLPQSFAALQKKVLPVETYLGQGTMTRWISNNPEKLCTVVLYDYSPQVIASYSDNALLEMTQEDVTMKGQILSQQNTTLGHFKGKSYWFRHPNGKAYGRFNFIVARPKLYQYGCIAGSEAALKTPEVNTFVQSFRLSHEHSLPGG
jgi:hypothetical protein